MFNLIKVKERNFINSSEIWYLHFSFIEVVRARCFTIRSDIYAIIGSFIVHIAQYFSELKFDFGQHLFSLSLQAGSLEAWNLLCSPTHAYRIPFMENSLVSFDIEVSSHHPILFPPFSTYLIEQSLLVCLLSHLDQSQFNRTKFD